jgi:pimeloyl-ACP methyl ester carboxylesterase
VGLIDKCVAPFVPQAWAYQIQHFGVSNGTTYEVIGIDNRGIGLSDVPLLPFNIVTMADDVHEIVLKEGCHPCHMVGISMGGMITLEFAYKYPHLLSSITLINTHAGGIRSIPIFRGIFGTLKSVINRDMSGDVIMFGSFTPVEKRGALTLKMWR